MNSLFLAALTVWHQRVDLFWPTWTGITVGSALFSGWTVHRAPGMSSASPLSDTAIQDEKSYLGRVMVPCVILTLLLSFYMVVNLTWENFAHHDDSALTLFTLRGLSFAPPIWRQQGRFWPLGHQEFNLIRHFTRSVAGYHILSIVQLLGLSGILLALDETISTAARATLAALILIAPGTVISYSSLLYPERNLVFWLAGLVWCVQKFESTASAVWALFAAISAQFVLYYKETAFILVLGFALTRLILRHTTKLKVARRTRSAPKEDRLDLCLAGLAGLFLVYYLVMMLPHLNMGYADQERLPIKDVWSAYLHDDFLVWIFAGFVIVRLLLIYKGRVAPSLLWEGLAVGGLLYFLSYLYLRMFSSYYLAPVDMISVLYLGRITIRSWARLHTMYRVLAIAAFCLIVVQNISLSTFRLFEDKNTLHAKDQIATVVAARYTNAGGRPLRLFVPFATPFSLMEFASYIDYRGIPVEGAPDDSSGKAGLVLASRQVESTGPCVSFRSVICHPGSSPMPGDLVLVLPDDDVSLRDVAPYVIQRNVIYSYSPQPELPAWMLTWFKYWHIVSIPFAHKQVSDHWLQASITAW